MEVRRLVEKNAAAYWALRLEGLEREPRSFGASPEEHLRITIEETAALILKSGSFLVGAFEADTLVGTARFHREPSAKERHKGHIYSVYVTASHRGRGVAKALIGAIVTELQDDSTFEQLLLSVGTFNSAARATYRAMGFVAYGIEPRAMKLGEEYIDEEHMILMLRPAK